MEAREQYEYQCPKFMFTKDHLTNMIEEDGLCFSQIYVLQVLSDFFYKILGIGNVLFPAAAMVADFPPESCFTVWNGCNQHVEPRPQNQIIQVYSV